MPRAKPAEPSVALTETPPQSHRWRRDDRVMSDEDTVYDRLEEALDGVRVLAADVRALAGELTASIETLSEDLPPSSPRLTVIEGGRQDG